MRLRSLSFNDAILWVLALLLAYALATAAVRLDGSLTNWHSVVFAFAPAIALGMLVVLTLVLKRQGVSVAALAVPRFPVSPGLVLAFLILMLLLGFLFFPIVQWGFTRTAITVVALGVGIASLLLILKGSDYGVPLLILAMPLLLQFDLALQTLRDVWMAIPGLPALKVFYLDNLPMTLLTMLTRFLATWILTYLAVLALLVRRIISRDASVKSPLYWLLGLHLLVTAAFAIYSPQHAYQDNATANIFVHGLYPLVFFSLFVNGIGSRKGLLLALSATVLAVFVWAASGFFLVIKDVSGSLTHVVDVRGASGTVQVFGVNINEVARLVTLAVPLALGLALYYRERAVKFFWAAVVLGLLLALVLTGSRDHWLWLPTGMLVFLVYPGFRRHLPLGFSLLVLLIVASGVALVVYARARPVGLLSVQGDERVERYVASQMGYRPNYWQSAWSMFTHNPLVGVGVGNFQASYQRYAPVILPIVPAHAHNLFLQSLAERGLVGSVPLFLLIFYIVRMGIQRLKALRHQEGFSIVLASFTSFVLLLLTGLTDEASAFGSDFALTMVVLWVVISCLHNAELLKNDSQPGEGSFAQAPAGQ